ncbi:MAG: erythromycin esterase family protein [Planctomycetes bacterium]|nr:erythromycin esterase family protein [Planctomycetota bacterium]MBI3848143.1 erythromycin esterase family protein [Planctomycetota bacterium]
MSSRISSCRAIVVVLALRPFVATAQEGKPSNEQAHRNDWWKKDACVIRSIDPADEDFADLAPLKKAIGDCRVVVLGEESHGDGATFLIKDRLVDFLHREMGFDVLAWESGISECRNVDELLADDATPLKDAIEGISPNWSRAAQVRPLFEYVRASRKTSKPISTVGIDCQLTSKQSASYLARSLSRIFEGVNPSPLTDEMMKWRPALEAYHTGKRYAASPEQANETEKATDTEALGKDLGAIVSLIERERATLEKHASPVDVEWVRRSFVAADYQVRLMHASNPNGMIDGAAELSTERDRLLGENLLFQVNEACRGHKVILWCASMHAMHHAPAITGPSASDSSPYQGLATMGEVARRALGNAMYTIGFTAGRGSHGWFYAKSGTPLPEPDAAWVESTCAAAKQPFLFIDFRLLPKDHWLREAQIMRPLGYSAMKAVWPEQMDAVIYIDEMFPASREGLAPPNYRLKVVEK